MAGSPTFVELFGGAGGLTLGLSQAGWTPLVAFDNWHDAAKTHADNFDHPVSTTAVEEIRGAVDGEIDSGPPGLGCRRASVPGLLDSGEANP